MRPFQDLRVWQLAHELVLDVYAVTKAFPRDETYGLISQVRRAASSIPANIAEGSARRTNEDFGRFLTIALGSAAELEYHLILARDLGYIEPPRQAELHGKVESVRKMLVMLRQRLGAPARMAPAADSQEPGASE